MARHEKPLHLPGEVFGVAGHTAFLIAPAQASRPRPWIWYAPALPGTPGPEENWMFEQFLAAGIAIAGIDVGESCGSPQGRRLFSALHTALTRRGYSKRPCLLARSRGGLMHYNWAAENPALVAGIAGIYPVCDLTTYPGLKNACGAYGLSEAGLAARLAEHNPVERLAPLARARVPLFHTHGTEDTVVPFDRNAELVARRYQKLGGPMILRVFEGQGHNWWPGWFQCQELVDFAIARACSR
ncbi:MAG: prolyl oligopeptidase family serine peptidase [Candidatus Latescibacteria bacterium]|nr:prolyl oligopeptidase family serine peptidase [Candidatus Latescibacterota bacterium]